MKSARIFSGSSCQNLAKSISQKSKIPLGNIEIGRFSDGEIDVLVKENVNNSNVFIIQSNSSPVNENIIELALIADALKRSGAQKITAVIPYFGYSRKEKQSRPGEPISAKVIADLIVASGVAKIICLDLHSDSIVGFFNVPVIYITALEILASRVKKEKITKPIIVSPDVGGVKRARNFANILNAPLVVIEKHRDTGKRDKIEILSMSGEIKGETAIIIDDLISTGSTIIESTNALKGKGVKKVFVCATHGVLTGDAIVNLEKSSVDKIFITDSIEQKLQSSKIEIVSVDSLFAKTLVGEI